LKGAAPDNIKTSQLYMDAISYVTLQLIVLLIVIFCPQLALWLPTVIDK